MPEQSFYTKYWKNPSIRFVLIFVLTFLFLYYFNLFYIGITAPGNYYNSFLDHNLNYISGLRNVLISITCRILEFSGYLVYTSEYTVHAMNVGGINLVYSCLGFGVMSFFTAFVIAWPEKPWRDKLIFLILGLLMIQALNITRFILIILFWRKSSLPGKIDHHTLFNGILYFILLAVIYLWINSPAKGKTVQKLHSKHS